jgi:hypothetical protein
MDASLCGCVLIIPEILRMETGHSLFRDVEQLGLQKTKEWRETLRVQHVRDFIQEKRIFREQVTLMVNSMERKSRGR